MVDHSGWVLTMLCAALNAAHHALPVRAVVCQHSARALCADAVAYFDVLHRRDSSPAFGVVASWPHDDTGFDDLALPALASAWSQVRIALGRNVVGVVRHRAGWLLLTSVDPSPGRGERLLVARGTTSALTPDHLDRLAAGRPAINLLERQIERSESVLSVLVALTPRERQVLELLAGGLSARAMSTSLVLSQRTVHRHLENLYRKLQVHDRLDAVNTAVRTGLLTRPGSG